MDSLLTSQFFRDEDRNFKVEEFRFRAKPLIAQIDFDESIDISSLMNNSFII